MFTKAFAATVLPSLALGALIHNRENDGDNDGDFYSDLSLRTVGARNTLVSPANTTPQSESKTDFAGLASMARESRTTHIILA